MMLDPRRLSLKNKIFFATLGVVLGVSAAIALLAREILVSSLTRELELRGAAIGQSVAERAANFILDNDQAGLVGLAFDSAQLGERRDLIAYVFVSGPGGEVLAHTFVRAFPDGLANANPLGENGGQSARLIALGDDRAYDVAVPVREGASLLGAVHVGIRKSHIDRLVGRLRNTFIAFISMLVLIIFFIALRLSNYVTRPLRRLTAIADEISRGNLDCDIGGGAPAPPEDGRCPAYANTDLPCWHFDQKLARDDRDVAPGNARTCATCVFYRKREGDEVVQVADSFNNMVWSIKLYRRRLRESEEKYRSLFDSNPDPVLVLDAATGRILDANPRAAEVYGYSRDELAGLDIAAIEPPDAPGIMSALPQDAPPGRCALFAKIRHQRKSGAPLYVNLHACRTRYRDKEAIIFSAADITDLVEKDAQLVQASKMKTLGEMSAGIAHELNQPLNAIRLGSDFLSLMAQRGQTVAPERFRDVTSQIAGQVERAAAIITHLREFGRKSDLASERVDINDPIRGVFTIIGQQLALQNIRVTLELGENLPKILAHANRLEQVFFNLVANARDALLDPSQSGKARDITIRSFREGARVAATFSDTGSGVAAPELHKIFEPFFSTKKTGHGMGLGLSISYGIVTDYGGDIEVDSQPGSGTTFKLSFPQAA
jgi:PAS domain S-box-containing protein